MCNDEIGVAGRVVIAALVGDEFLAAHEIDFDRLDTADPDLAAMGHWSEWFAGEWSQGTRPPR